MEKTWRLCYKMEGTVVNYRQGRHTQNTSQMIIKVAGVEKKQDAEKLKGKKVVWKSPVGKEMIGRVLSAHGNKGAIRAKFDKGLPGQSIGKRVQIE